MYVVQVFRKWGSLEVLGLPLSAEQGTGCVGFMPIFDDLELAQMWRDTEHPTAGIVAIAEGRDEEATL
jgi:hypothetical protein